MSKKLKIKIAALALAALLTLPALSGCGNGGNQGGGQGNGAEISGGESGDRGGEESNNERFTVTFLTDGGTEVESQTVNKGEKAVKPNNPEKTNCVFKGWYLGDTEWNFETMTVAGDVSLSAKWEAEFTPPYLPRSNKI